MCKPSLSQKKNLFFILLAVLFLPSKTEAQFGITAGYQVNQVDSWIVSVDGTETEINGSGISLGLDYWFRLKNQRIEFLPELNYSLFRSAPLSNNEDISVDFISFYFNTNIYLLDLLNDCNCPTFSKQNDFFKKGFFIQISPGLTLPNFYYSADQSNQAGTIVANIGLGLGLDIGLTDLITISPIIKARYQPTVEWNATFPASSSPDDPNPSAILEAEANILQYFAGLRLGIRLDNG